MRYFLIGALALAIAAPVAAAPQRQPATIVSILVDLSQTWHNQESLTRNRRLLASVSKAIADANAALPKPILVSYRIIGENSLTKDAFYITRFAPSLLAKTDADSAASIGVFRQRLAGPRTGWTAAAGPVAYDPVPLTMLRLQPEQRTEIMGAVIAARRADALAASDAVRMMFVLSDFKEDSRGAYKLTDSLKGYRIVLIGRVLGEDAKDADALNKRTTAFKKALTARQATVRIFEESAVLQSPADFAGLIDRLGRQ